MTDIFDEVGEDLRRDQMKRIWQRYSALIIGVAVLIVAGTAGWRGYESWQASQAETAGQNYIAALAATTGEDHKAAADALVAFASSAPKNYASLALFRAASERALAGETDAALAGFDALAKDTSNPQEMRDLATIRAAMIAVDREDLAAIKARVGALDTEISSWRHSARELIALAAVKAEAWEDARATIAKAVADPKAPQDVQARLRILQGVITAAVGEPAKTPEAGS
jgi:hypothetical protein